MRVMVRILLFKHRGGFTSCHVNSLVRGIEPHIVVQRRTGERGHNFSRISVEHKELGGFRVAINTRWFASSRTNEFAVAAPGMGHRVTTLRVAMSTTPTSLVARRLTYIFLLCLSMAIASDSFPGSVISPASLNVLVSMMLSTWVFADSSPPLAT